MIEIPAWLIGVLVVRVVEEIYNNLPPSAQRAMDAGAETVARASVRMSADMLGNTVESALLPHVGEAVAKVAGESAKDALRERENDLVK